MTVDKPLTRARAKLRRADRCQAERLRQCGVSVVDLRPDLVGGFRVWKAAGLRVRSTGSPPVL